MIMMEIQTNLCNKCMSTVLMLTLLDPTLAFACYYTWAKTHEPWEYDYSIAFCTKLRHSISYTSITIIMKSISQQTQNDIISLLEQGKSCRQIAQEIGVHYSTVSKFHLKLNFTPPKGKGGHPSKLTPTVIHHSICIISIGKADTAVDVTKSLQETFPGTISASTVRRGLKKSGLKAVVKTKALFFPNVIIERGLILPKPMNTGLWKTGRGLFGQMRPKSIVWSQMGGSGCRKRRGRALVTGWCRKHSNMEVDM